MRYTIPMADAAQVALTVSVPTLAVMIGILINNARLGDVNKRLDDFRVHFDARFSALDALFTERLRRVEEVIDVRLSRIEQELHLK